MINLSGYRTLSFAPEGSILTARDQREAMDAIRDKREPVFDGT